MTEHLRAHLEAIRERHVQSTARLGPTDRRSPLGICTWCGEPWECLDYSDAVAALELLEVSDDLLDDIRLDSGSDTFAAVGRQIDAIKALAGLLGDADPEPRAADVEPRSADEAPA